MSRLAHTLLAVWFAGFLVATTTFASDNITLNLPESVISEAVTAVLPLEVDATSKTLQGTITIISISDLQLSDDHLACRLHLAGDNLQFLTEMAGHEIRLKVGAVDIDFTTKARLRFDRAKQNLYIRPIIDDIQASQDASGGDIGHALVSLLNGKEFPVNVQDLDPLIANTGAKTLTITMEIADIQAHEDLLQLSLAPKIATRDTTQKQ